MANVSSFPWHLSSVSWRFCPPVQGLNTVLRTPEFILTPPALIRIRTLQGIVPIQVISKYPLPCSTLFGLVCCAYLSRPSLTVSCFSVTHSCQPTHDRVGRDKRRGASITILHISKSHHGHCKWDIESAFAPR